MKNHQKVHSSYPIEIDRERLWQIALALLAQGNTDLATAMRDAGAQLAQLREQMYADGGLAAPMREASVEARDKLQQRKHVRCVVLPPSIFDQPPVPTVKIEPEKKERDKDEADRKEVTASIRIEVQTWETGT